MAVRIPGHGSSHSRHLSINSNREAIRRDRTASLLLTKQRLTLTREQHPKPIHAKRGSKRHMEQIESGNDDRQHASPGPQVQQSNTSDDSGDRKHQDKNHSETANHYQDRDRKSVV